MRLKNIYSILSEMARTPEYCGNCGFPKTGKHPSGQQYHFYRQGKYYCTSTSLAAAKNNGLTPTGNLFVSAGTTPPTKSSSPAPAQEPTPNVQPPTPHPQAKPKSNDNSSAVVDDLDTDGETITKKELEQWLSSFDIAPNQYSIVNGRLNIDSDINFNFSDFVYIPVPFGTIKGSFHASIVSLESFKNFPTKVERSLFADDTDISSFEGLDVSVGHMLDLSSNDLLTDLRGIHKHINYVGHTLRIDIDHVTHGGLGILMIKGLKHVLTRNTEVDDILNKYLGTKDILAAQEELIDAGFNHIARI